MPQSDAGTRIDPTVSEPSATGASAAATATAEPLDEPPATRCVRDPMDRRCAHRRVAAAPAERELDDVRLAERDHPGSRRRATAVAV